MSADFTNPLEERLGYQLRRASVVMMADLAARLEALELTVTEASILVLVGANPGAIQTRIGRALGIKRANMVPLIAGLERRKLVRRAPADGRSQGLRLAPRGELLAENAASVMRLHETKFLGTLTEAGRRQLRARLAQIWAEQRKD